ncbi:MAG: hypothetical protein H0U95_11430 [Bacteroidetes bacterium]|nr:hypothetical protein [Bacteroidota bacterium]
MRKIEFEVPTEVFGDFTEKLAETGLNNRVLGKNEDDEIEIEVFYDKEDAKIIDELEEHLEELIENIEEEDDDEEEEDEDK